MGFITDPPVCLITPPQGKENETKPQPTLGLGKSTDSLITFNTTTHLQSTTSLTELPPNYQEVTNRSQTSTQPSTSTQGKDELSTSTYDSGVDLVIGILSMSVVTVMMIFEEIKILGLLPSDILPPTPTTDRTTTTTPGSTKQTGQGANNQSTEPNNNDDTIVISASVVFLGLIILLIAVAAWCRWSQSSKEREKADRRDSTTPLREGDELQPRSRPPTPAASDTHTSNYSVPHPLRSEQNSVSAYALPGPPQVFNKENTEGWGNDEHMRWDNGLNQDLWSSRDYHDHNEATSWQQSDGWAPYHHLEPIRPRTETGYFTERSTQPITPTVSYSGNIATQTTGYPAASSSSERSTLKPVFYISPGMYVYKATEV